MKLELNCLPVDLCHRLLETPLGVFHAPKMYVNMNFHDIFCAMLKVEEEIKIISIFMMPR